MREAVICHPVRTPIGRYGGMFRYVTATELAVTVVRAVLERAGLNGGLVDDIILGQCYPNGEAPAIGRIAGLNAGLGVDVPGLQLDRRCGSGLQAICDASMRIQTGVADVVIAGGVESMSQVEYYATGLRWGTAGASIELHDRLVRGRVTAGGERHPVPGGMVETAENVRVAYGIAREEQDQLALLSHQRACRAQREGLYEKEIVPVEVVERGTRVKRDRDEHPRPDSSLAKLAALKPIRRESDPDATVTAGNASGQNDAAAACLVTTREFALEYGLEIAGVLQGWAVAGVSPDMMGMGPVPATEKVLDALDLTLHDMDLIELNEAFAAQVLGVTREWSFEQRDFERLNVNGSGISLGHPVGATGARMLATLTHEMSRRDSEWGLVTMCIGGGQGLAAVIRRSGEPTSSPALL